MGISNDLSLYIHIPFCVRKCAYCDFLSFSSTDRMDSYVDELLNEISINVSMYFEYEIKSIFFGGGTPSILKSGQVERIMERIRDNYDISDDCEITIEANPGTLSDEKLREYISSGINRISMGVQSLNDDELKVLGRIHDSADFYRSFDQVIKAGFNNLSVDLMYGIPGQTVLSYEKTLRSVTDLGPELKHVSAYSLIVEEGTPFYERYDKGTSSELPEEDEEREMDKITNDILSKRGFMRYEISNYSKKGFRSRHNCTYWTRGNYLGLGLNASSMVDDIRFRNTADMDEYLSGDHKKYDYHVLTQKEQMEEFMFLGLRMSEGISVNTFRERFNSEFPQKYWDVIYDGKNHDLLDICDDGDDIRVMLTNKGRDVSNVILSEFLF